MNIRDKVAEWLTAYNSAEPQPVITNDDIMYGMQQTPQPVRTPPMLIDIMVEPVLYAGEAIKHKLIMRFDRGEIVVGMAQNAEGLLQLRKDIYAELRMDEA